MRICWEDIGYVIEETFHKMGMNKKVHIKGIGENSNGESLDYRLKVVFVVVYNIEGAIPHSSQKFETLCPNGSKGHFSRRAR